MLSCASGVISAGYNGNQVIRYQPPSQHLTSNLSSQFEDTSFIPQNQFIGSNHTQFTRNDSTSLALAPPQQQQSLEFQPIGQLIQPSNGNSYDDWPSQPDTTRVTDDLFSEEEIRMRSHEMLENEDMQHLLRVFSMGGSNLHEDGYSFPSFMPSPCPNFQFDEDRRRSSGKAVVGWLKIKAAMRWGIFVRKKAAERRAQLVELED